MESKANITLLLNSNGTPLETVLTDKELETKRIVANKFLGEIITNDYSFRSWLSWTTQWKDSQKFLAFEFWEEYFKDEIKDLKNFPKEELKDKIGNMFNKRQLAEKVIEFQPCYYDKSRSWWLWDWSLKKWDRTDETDILNAIENQAAINTINSKEKTEILEALKQVSRLNKPADIKPTWIQFKDTIVDIKTGDRIKATPNYFVTNPIPYKLHESEFYQTPVMDKIFEEWVGKEYVQTLYEIIAYCLLPDYPLNRIFCFIGAGMNGKSCFLNLLRKFIGKSNVCSTELDTLLRSRFEVTRLHKKLVCQMGETDFSEMEKTSILKKITGGDLIGFEYKNKDPFEDINYAKILIATNNLPSTKDKTIGFYRRWVIIDFPNQFNEKKNILSDIPEEEYESLALKCTLILKDLLKDRKFTNEGEIADKKEKYENHSNPFNLFMKEFIDEDVDGYIFKWEFSKTLNDWAKENRFRDLTDTFISSRMKGLEINTSKVSTIQDGTSKRWNAWSGIKWKDRGDKK